METAGLKVYFLPYLAPSHILPLVNIAKLFASHGVHVTILTTFHNSLLFKDQLLHPHLHLIDFPAKEVGLPQGVENFSSATADMVGKVFRAFLLLQKPMEQAIRAARPDCLVADIHYFWASDLAHQLNIPYVVFHGRSYFALCADDSITRYAPHEQVKSDKDLFLLPGLPDSIQMSRSELPEWIQARNGYTDFIDKMNKGDYKSYGVLVESFYELENEYADHYMNKLGRRAWSIGPLGLHCENVISPNEKTERNNKHMCLEWLDKMQTGRVVYLSFGSQSCFSAAQLLELATALESSGHPFIWVVRRGENKSENGLLEGFEERIKKQDRGIVVKDWAPQVMILNHPSIGGFVTHCGWNSVLESVTSGVPMVTWPLSAEHFYNEKLVTEVLKIGVQVGTKRWSRMIDESCELVGREMIQTAVQELMGGGGEATERRRRAKEMSKEARKAVEVGGSSSNNLKACIDELLLIHKG